MNYKNNAFSVLASSITSGATALSVSAGTGSRFPVADFPVTLIGYDGSGNENAWEIVRCTARSGDLLTIVRAQEGTTATAWPAAARIENRVTAGSMDGLQNKQMVSDAEPSIRYNGDEWTDGTTGIKYTWIEDGTSGQWVELGPGGAKHSWVGLADKPAFIAAGATAAEARAVLELGTAALAAAPSSALVGVSDSQTLSGKTLAGLKEVKAVLAANDIDLATGNIFTKTISAGTTLTVSNVPAAGTTASFILDLTNGGAGAVTWWSGVKWSAGAPPALTAAGRDALGFFTHDGGTTWTGLLLGKDIK